MGYQRVGMRLRQMGSSKIARAVREFRREGADIGVRRQKPYNILFQLRSCSLSWLTVCKRHEREYTNPIKSSAVAYSCTARGQRRGETALSDLSATDFLK